MAYFSQSPGLSNPSGALSSYLIEAPAGSLGFVKTIPSGDFQGKLGFQIGGNYRRAFFFGVVTNNGWNFVSQSDSASHVALLSRLGFNAIRFHYVDVFLISSYSGATCNLSATSFTRLDEAIYEMKQKGIYVLFDLFSGGTFGYPQFMWEQTSSDWLDRFKNYISQLANHVNSLTGLAYKDEPAILGWMLTNERYFVAHWRDTNHTYKGGGTNIPTTDVNGAGKDYVALIDSALRTWLQSKYTLIANLNAAWGSEGYSSFSDPNIQVINGTDTSNAQKHRDMTEFFCYIQSDFNSRLSTYIKTTLGAQQLVFGGTGYTWSPQTYAESATDGVCTNIYQDHPSAGTVPFEGLTRWADSTVVSSPGAAAKYDSMLSNVFSANVKNKARLITEFSSPWYHTYHYQFLPMLASYAVFNDVDAIFLHSTEATSHLTSYGGGPRLATFDTIQNPVRRSQLNVASNIFRRRDVPVGPIVDIEHNINGSGYNDMTQLSLGGRLGDFVYGSFDARNSAGTTFPSYGAMRRRIRKTFKTSGADIDWHLKWPDPNWDQNVTLHQATGLDLNQATNLWKLDTPYTQGAVGALTGTIILSNVTIASVSGFANGGAVLVTSLDDRPIKATNRVLVSICGHLKTSGGYSVTNIAIPPYTKEFTNQAAWGTSPYLCEAGVCTVTMWRKQYGPPVCYALNANGERGATVTVFSAVYEDPIEGSMSKDSIIIDTDVNDALSYEIVRS